MTKTWEEKRAHKNEIHRRVDEGEMTLPESILFIREGLGWSQEYFAEKFHVSLEQLQAIERGEMGELFEALARIGKPWRFEIAYVNQKRRDQM
ncbi:multiprotein-bridging factor 1 family protein [Sulfitobacter sp. 1A12126]|uniref:helix-turn-helix domain-containing protein n=1 Tax=Sulfitobacter sp. 1A12126 TaxID=3368591 RepID=UPI0037474278